jgi:hypothetical protein
MTLTREIKFYPKKDYGIHSVTLFMGVKGPLGAVQLIIYTNWLLPNMVIVSKAADLGYHWLTPRYENQLKLLECKFTGSHCYYDGSEVVAQEYFDALVEFGSDKVWEMLENYYNELANDNK